MVCNKVEKGSKSNTVNGGTGELRTYKRRKHSNNTCPQDLESATQSIKEPLDGVLQSSYHDQVGCPRVEAHATNSLDDIPPKHWKGNLPDHCYQSLGKTQGGIWGCTRDALVFHNGTGRATGKGSVKFHEDGQKLSSQTGWELNGTRSEAKGHAGVVSNRSFKESNHRSVTELCQCAFFDITVSEMFAQFCSLLFQNFEGMEVNSFFGISLISSRMKEGAYEINPALFHSDIQQVWTKIQKVGTEMVTLATSLSDESRTSSFKWLEGSEHFTSEDGKDQSGLERKEASGVYKVCSCRVCGEKADGRDCLVCDSCEEMFHIPCIKPAVNKIPVNNWYCADCSANGIKSPSKNFELCERLNAPTSLNHVVGDNVILANEGTIESKLSSTGLGDGLQISKGGTNSCCCHLCGSEVQKGEKFMLCGHPFCYGKYYHVRCLTGKQLDKYGPCWYCPSCLCRVCLTDKDDDKIVLCDGCNHAYHIYCMQPPRASVPRKKWFCGDCNSELQRIRKARRSFEKRQNKHEEKCEIARDNSGGVDMLLTAARSLKDLEEFCSN